MLNVEINNVLFCNKTKGIKESYWTIYFTTTTELHIEFEMVTGIGFEYVIQINF